MKYILAVLVLIGTSLGQSGPSVDYAPAMQPVVSSTGTGPFYPLTTTGTFGPSYDYAPTYLMLGYNSTTNKYYVCGAANPCTGAGGSGSSGVSSFNGRTGSVTPAVTDYPPLSGTPSFLAEYNGSGTLADTSGAPGTSTVSKLYDYAYTWTNQSQPQPFAPAANSGTLELTLSRNAPNANVFSIQNIANPFTDVTGREDSAITYRDYQNNEHAALGYTIHDRTRFSDVYTKVFGTGSFWEISDLTGSAEAPPARIIQTQYGTPRLMVEVSPPSTANPDFGGTAGAVNFYGHVGSPAVAIVAVDGSSTAGIRYFNMTSNVAAGGETGVANSGGNGSFADQQAYFVSDTHPVFIHAGPGKDISFEVDSAYNASYAFRIFANSVNSLVPFFAPQVNIAPTTFASLPTCNSGLEGTFRAVTDSTTATYNATVTGGGTNHIPAYCNGTNWTAH